jgi:hypothetical protein
MEFPSKHVQEIAAKAGRLDGRYGAEQIIRLEHLVSDWTTITEDEFTKLVGNTTLRFRNGVVQRTWHVVRHLLECMVVDGSPGSVIERDAANEAYFEAWKKGVRSVFRKAKKARANPGSVKE